MSSILLTPNITWISEAMFTSMLQNKKQSFLNHFLFKNIINLIWCFLMSLPVSFLTNYKAAGAVICFYHLKLLVKFYHLFLYYCIHNLVKPLLS